MQKPAPDFRSALNVAVDQAISYLERLDDSSVDATADLHTLRARIDKPFAERGAPTQQKKFMTAAPIKSSRRYKRAVKHFSAAQRGGAGARCA